jgi:hypothetical protein
MPDLRYPDVPDDFAHWLAGLIAGEGSFGIYLRARRKGYQVQFVLSLRADDRPILEEIQRTTGLGTLLAVRRPQGNDLVAWKVITQRDMLRLVVILDGFPLRARKADDYAIWRQAVFYVSTSIRVGPRGRTNNWEPVKVLAEDLYCDPRGPDFGDGESASGVYLAGGDVPAVYFP